MKPTETSEAAYIDNTQLVTLEQTMGDGSNGPLADLPRKTDLNDEVLAFLLQMVTALWPSPERKDYDKEK